MMTLKTAVVIIFLMVDMSISIGCRRSNQIPSIEAKPPVESNNGNLVIPTTVSNMVCEYYKDSLPPKLLDRLVQAIEFSFQSGAHREINYRDLYHAHILTDKPGNSLDGFTGILLHTQELSSYSPEIYKKRNIFIDYLGHTSIIPCEQGQATRSFSDTPGICTVKPIDLDLREIVQVNFVKVDQITPDHLSGYEQNIRTIRSGEKILFGTFQYKFLK